MVISSPGTLLLLLIFMNASAQPTTVPELILVEGATFAMGNLEGDEDERPVRKVAVESFWITKTEITVAQWKSFCSSVNRPMPSEPAWGWIDDFPVVNITWHDAVEYCAWLSEKTGKKFRLPNEFEWEFAAKGGNKSRNTLYSGSDNVDSIGVYKKTIDVTRPNKVAIKSANELGIFDMSGNVWEWCDDWYSDGFKTIRGGGWVAPPADLRTTNRWREKPESPLFYLGFRPVASVHGNTIKN